MARVPAPAAVLFDLDGTLVDTVPTRIEAWRRAFAERGIAVDRARLGHLIGSDGRLLARTIMDEADRPYDMDELGEIDKRAGEIHGELNTSPRVLPGAVDLTAELDRRGIIWAIATSSRPEQVSASVAALGFDQEPRIIDGSHVEQAKPAPDLLLLGARQLAVDPTTCWYIGDSTWDMRAAASARMIAIAVTAGSAVDGRSLRDAGADHVVPTLTALLADLADPTDASGR